MKKLLLILIVFAACSKPDIERVKLVEADESKLLPPDMSAARGKPVKPCRGNNCPTNPPPPPPPPPPAPGTAKGLAFIDTDGHVSDMATNDTMWAQAHNLGQPIISAPAIVTEAEKQELVSEFRIDYAGFNIDVTTDEAYYNSFVGKKTRVVLTPSSFSSGSGRAFTGSANLPGGNTVYVFTDRLLNWFPYYSKIITHEFGHASGLNHQQGYDANCVNTTNYREGWHMGVTWSQRGIFGIGATFCCTCIVDENAVLANTYGIL